MIAPRARSAASIWTVLTLLFGGCLCATRELPAAWEGTFSAQLMWARRVSVPRYDSYAFPWILGGDGGAWLAARAGDRKMTRIERDGTLAFLALEHIGSESTGLPIAVADDFLLVREAGLHPSRLSLLACNAGSGELQWRVRMSQRAGGTSTGGPTLALPGADRVIAAETGQVRCLDLKTGREQWRVPWTEEFRSLGRLAAGGKSLYCANARVVFSLDLATGGILWTKALGDTHSHVSCDIHVSPPSVYVGYHTTSDAGERAELAVARLDQLTGETVWIHAQEWRDVGREYLAPHVTGVALHGPVVVLGTTIGLSGVDAMTGRTLWTLRREELETRALLAGPILFSDHAAACARETTFGFSPRTGKVLWRFPIGGRWLLGRAGSQVLHVAGQVLDDDGLPPSFVAALSAQRQAADEDD